MAFNVCNSSFCGTIISITCLPARISSDPRFLCLPFHISFTVLAGFLCLDIFERRLEVARILCSDLMDPASNWKPVHFHFGSKSWCFSGRCQILMISCFNWLAQNLQSTRQSLLAINNIYLAKTLRYFLSSLRFFPWTDLMRLIIKSCSCQLIKYTDTPPRFL